MKLCTLRIWIFLAVSTGLSTQGYANPSCEIDENKKRAIYELLCGQMAAEADYRFSGSGCFAKSMGKRLDDSAIHILAHRLCGEGELSERIKEANLKAMKFMETLSVCTPERVDLKQLMEEALKRTAQRAAGRNCTTDLRANLVQRRTFFEKMIGLANDQNFLPAMLEKMGLRLDGDGSIRER